MADNAKEALGIYEMICATSGDRPFGGTNAVLLLLEIAGWKKKNPALKALTHSAPEVKLAFLEHSLEWLRAELRQRRNFHVTQTLYDAVLIAVEQAPKPLPAELVWRLLSEYRQDASMSRIYFPFKSFLSVLRRDQVTDQIRDELRRLHLQFAPSPTGKIDEKTQEVRDLITDLIWVEGEKALEPGRGPWSQIVFDEIGAKDEITRLGWESLLEHCRGLEQTVPGGKWNKKSRELITALGEGPALAAMLRWLALGPTPGQPPEARSPIEDSEYQKGVVSCLALSRERDAAIAIADFGIACLRKIPMLGAVSQRVGFACINALGAMESGEAVAQLTRLRAKVKYSVARRLIEKSLHKAAERSGLTVDELEDMSVPRYGLDAQGVIEVSVGDARATLRLSENGRVAVSWQNAEGNAIKSAPARVKKDFAKEIRSLSARAKELEQAYQAQRVRLEFSLLAGRSMLLDHWQQYFIEHPLLGFLGRRLIWVFSEECSGLWSDGAVRDASGQALNLNPAEKVRLWHPLSSDAADVERWRERVFSGRIRQPFRQAFREFYQVTVDERQTRMYSNRFAGALMRQHQFATLCRERGWSYQLMGAGFDGFNVPRKKLDPWNMHAEFYIDLPSDRDHSLRDSALDETSGAGINLFIGSDQVRFYRDRREISVDEVPAIVYSEVMRDIDLFTSVCGVGDDATWSDQGERSTGVFSQRFDVQELSAIIALRAQMLSRVLPQTAISDRCKIVKTWLEVRGQLGTYRIELGWSGTQLITDSGTRWLKIPQRILDAVPLDLGSVAIDLDYRTETILRKAHLLANDWKIDSPGLIRQLMSDSGA